MRFNTLSVRNFRAIRELEIVDLADVVLIAGPNGCGKSAALDAIRLLKSIYGGYQIDEWRSWFSEFQIDVQDRAGLARLFRDPSQTIEVAASFTLYPSERKFLLEQAESVVEPLIWRQILGRDFDRRGQAFGMSFELRVHDAQVRERVGSVSAQLREALEADTFNLAFRMEPGQEMRVQPCLVADVVFQTYEPDHLGVIDYHSAARAYNREGVGAVSLNLAPAETGRRDQRLYNWQAKYQNVKQELASSYVRETFARQAGADLPTSDLNATLADLFQTFFPNKTYEGPRPTPEGILEFPVRLSSGEVHDIDDLSSGEKEILYGYLRLRNSTPRNSVILLDEPELHLNPGLLQGLAEFYHRHIGRALGNQLWLVTHSDALLREAVGNQNFSVFHLRTAWSTNPGENQALHVSATDELDRAVIDLVGDLATYKPNAKVVILEGGGGSDFDVRMVTRLFPLIAQRVNLVSGGGKRRVRDLYTYFSELAARAGLSEKFFAVVDRDSPIQDLGDGAEVRRWDRYHIENYLLEPRFILSAVEAVTGSTAMNEHEVLESLRDAARNLVSRLVLERLQAEANSRLVGAIRVGASSTTSSPAEDLLASIQGSSERFGDAAQELLDGSFLSGLEAEYRAELEAGLESDGWRAVFPGRLILAAFVDQHVRGVNYEAFRNLILDQMADERYEPPGMAEVLESIGAE